MESIKINPYRATLVSGNDSAMWETSSERRHGGQLGAARPKGKTISAYFESQCSLNMFESLNSVLICLRLFLFILKVPLLEVPLVVDFL